MAAHRSRRASGISGLEIDMSNSKIELSDIRISITPQWSMMCDGRPRVVVGYLASAGETATDYGAHIGSAEARTIQGALHKVAQDLANNPYTMHAPNEVVHVVYYRQDDMTGCTGYSECTTSLIDWSFDRAGRVADKLVGDE